MHFNLNIISSFPPLPFLPPALPKSSLSDFSHVSSSLKLDLFFFILLHMYTYMYMHVQVCTDINRTHRVHLVVRSEGPHPWERLNLLL